MIDILKAVPPSPEQWEIVIEGVRNYHDSRDNSDSLFCRPENCSKCEYFPGCDAVAKANKFLMGRKDYDLMLKLAKSGSSLSKYRRMLPVILTVNAPLYWWKEFDTYKVGTVENSCTTTHSIHKKEFTLSDFSYENLLGYDDDLCWGDYVPLAHLEGIVAMLNQYRKLFLDTEDKKYWWQMIQMLPTSYNQKRTVSLNYEVLSNIYFQRKEHRLDEWRVFCELIRSLPYSGLMTCAPGGDDREE